MSSHHDDLVVAAELAKYIKAHGQKDDLHQCWKIDAATGWAKFLAANPHLKDSGRKPKKLCEASSAMLHWISDDSAPGKGYITVPFGGKTNQAVLVKKTDSHVVENALKSMKDVTITTDHKLKTTHLTGKTPSKTEIVEVEKKVIPLYFTLNYYKYSFYVINRIS